MKQSASPFPTKIKGEAGKGSLTPLQEDAEEEQQHAQESQGSAREHGMIRRLSAVVKKAALTARRRSLIFDPGDYVDNSNRPPMQRGPSMRHIGSQHYLKEEMVAAREAVKALDEAVARAKSFRERASRLLEEAHRALGRLEQATETKSAPELILIACEIKVSARRGLTLVDVYGRMGTFGKMVTLCARGSIYSKYDKVCDHLNTLLVISEAAILPSTAKSMESGSSAAVAGAAAASPASGVSVVAAVPHPPHGVELRVGKQDKVHCVAYVPSAVESYLSETICIWWSAGNMLEFFSEAGQSTTAFGIEKPHLLVTSVAIDLDGNVWTGHVKGLLRVRRNQQWDYIQEDSLFQSSAIRCIVFDNFDFAWVGDDSGRVRVLRFDADEAKLHLVSAVTPLLSAGSGSQNLSGAVDSFFNRLKGSPSKHAGGIGPLSVIRNISVSRKVSDSGAVPSPLQESESGPGPLPSGLSSLPRRGRPGRLESPIRCIHVQGPQAWISSGKGDTASITLWSTSTYQDLDCWDCGQFGPCSSMKAMGWGLDVFSLRRVGHPAASLTSFPSYHTSVSQDQDEPFQTTTSRASDPSGVGSMWRLLTGHESGQIVLWHPDAHRLMPLMYILEPGSPIRGLMVFEQYNLVCTAHANGDIQVFIRPSMGGMSISVPLGPFATLPPGSESAHPNSFGLYRPKKVSIKAHKSPMVMMLGTAGSMVTASIKGTIRLWHAEEIAAEAERGGIVVTPAMADRVSSVHLNRPPSKGYVESRSDYFNVSSTNVGRLSYPEGSAPSVASGKSIVEGGSLGVAETQRARQQSTSGASTQQGGDSFLTVQQPFAQRTGKAAQGRSYKEIEGLF
ncbi:hypothetical protein CEUSTIGMA_g2700.t1 [Chlamydomonas eustigma]|uniref:Uncharacterized protein n=1 Tax=Chlamydomonas eustigma TaxID=1157962 RepID=A0A250WWT5_9CHLO|nr:hypothetical protein CEUSTIGMA_g2700.t1 [Chlamydomonas eustigma]|eukprot:GAX75255.1 hypothetical protein CEUSTIGMA_g2700.t1 [Chlamydomonas eustigma]